MKKIYYNGKFHTMQAVFRENASTQAEPQFAADPAMDAVCCEDGVITALGSYGQFAPSLLSEAETQDLNGAHVFPGFIDTYSAPAFDAFDEAALAEGDFHESDVLYWVSQAMEYLNDKGVCVLCLHGKGTQPNSPFRKVVGTEDTSLLYGITYQTDYELDLYEGCFNDILENPKTSLLLFQPLYDDSETVEEALIKLTYGAATHIGRLADLGTLDVGKRANFTIYDENPLEKNLAGFSHMHADMIINEGNVVYNAYDQAMEELYDLLSSQMF